MTSYGELRTGLERMMNYYSKFQAVLILYIAWQQGFPIWIVAVSIFFVPVFMWFDLKYLFPREQEYWTKASKPFMDMDNKLDKILACIRR